MDDFTPEDRYFYLYLLTNPHTNLCGCYEVSVKQMADELGYSKETIDKLMTRFEEIHKQIIYDVQTKEMLISNWNKYNWSKSPQCRKALDAEIECIKSERFAVMSPDERPSASERVRKLPVMREKCGMDEREADPRKLGYVTPEAIRRAARRWRR